MLSVHHLAAGKEVRDVSFELKKGEVLGYLHANDEKRLEAAKEKFRSAYFITDYQPEAEPLIKGILQ